MSVAQPARNRDRQGASFSTYLITFVCYGSWLPGQPGAIDRSQNGYGSRLPEPDSEERDQARSRMKQEPYLLDAIRREVVLTSLKQVCFHRDWTLLAAHVRTNHVHVLVAASHSAEHVMNAFKAYASRALNAITVDSPNRRRWARHGSTRHLWTTASVSAAVHYVVCEQGEPMAIFEMPSAR